jgi:3',5'-cyclic AMP phosphodiesterase CpdA
MRAAPLWSALVWAAAFGAAPTPTRIILTWSGDPAHTQSVTWRTEPQVASPQAQVAQCGADPKFEAKAVTMKATAVTDDLGNGRTAGHYTVQFDRLEPKTQYCYRVGYGSAWSEWNVFRTAAAEAEPFRFLYIGDAQNNIRSLWSRSIRAAFQGAPDARFIVHAGDLLAEGWDDRLWGEWSDAIGFISGMVPSVPVPGNHDLHRAPGDPDRGHVFSVSPLWRSHFSLPQNGPEIPEIRSQSYYLDYQGVRVIALDVNVFANEDFAPDAAERVRRRQLEWLERILRDNPNRWTIVVQHQPAYPMARGRRYLEMRAALEPLYDKYGVDLVLQGHDHLYARSHKVAAGKIVDPAARGPIYVISVSGPKMYDADKENAPLMAKVITGKEFFQAIDVSRERLRFTAYTIDGAVADRFELTKNGTDRESVYAESTR